MVKSTLDDLTNKMSDIESEKGVLELLEK